MEDRFLFIGVPSLLLAGIPVWMQQHFGKNLTGLLAVVCVFLYSLPFLTMIAVTFMYFREERDEFQTQLLSGAMLCGIGGTLLVTTLWGAMEQFRLVPVFHVMWVMPMFGMFYSFALAIQRWRYR
jgi:hypothetical protein